MHYKTNRVNHDFQIAYFLAGSCHTPDAAYALLCDLREDRLMAIEAATTLSWWARFRSKFVVDRPIAREVGRRCLEAAKAELATIEKCIAIVQPMRKFAHLPDAEAHEAAQQEEWRLELIHRAENSLIGTGLVAPDQLTAMRQHPEFMTSIWPELQRMEALLARPGGAQVILGKEKFSLPALLAGANT